MQEQEKRNIIKKMTIQEKQLNEDLEKDLKKAEIKKDKALDKDPNVLKQIKIGLGYRKDQGLAVLKNKSKKLLSKTKNKVYGQIDLLKNKID
jgi:hypothetical protein